MRARQEDVNGDEKTRTTTRAHGSDILRTARILRQTAQNIRLERTSVGPLRRCRITHSSPAPVTHILYVCGLVNIQRLE